MAPAGIFFQVPCSLDSFPYLRFFLAGAGLRSWRRTASATIPFCLALVWPAAQTHGRSRARKRRNSESHSVRISGLDPDPQVHSSWTSCAAWAIRAPHARTGTPRVCACARVRKHALAPVCSVALRHTGAVCHRPRCSASWRRLSRRRPSRSARRTRSPPVCGRRRGRVLARGRRGGEVNARRDPGSRRGQSGQGGLQTKSIVAQMVMCRRCTLDVRSLVKIGPNMGPNMLFRRVFPPSCSLPCKLSKDVPDRFFRASTSSRSLPLGLEALCAHGANSSPRSDLVHRALASRAGGRASACAHSNGFVTNFGDEKRILAWVPCFFFPAHVDRLCIAMSGPPRFRSADRCHHAGFWLVPRPTQGATLWRRPARHTRDR